MFQARLQQTSRKSVYRWTLSIVRRVFITLRDFLRLLRYTAFKLRLAPPPCPIVTVFSMQKTGSSSLWQALRRAKNEGSERIVLNRNKVEWSWELHSIDPTRPYPGLYPDPDYSKFITVVRNPIDRIISSYFYNPSTPPPTSAQAG